MAVRTLNYTLSAGDILPSMVQAGGMQFEHNATVVNFTIPAELYASISAAENGETLLFRVDVSDGEGGYHPSESITPVEDEGDYVLSYSIPYEIASVGGLCRLTVVASKVGTDNKEQMIFCSAPALIEFEQVARGTPNTEQFMGELSGILQEAKDCMILSTVVNNNSELVITYKNGTVINAGKVELPDTDSVPTIGSSKPVESGGVFTELAKKADTASLADVAISGSYNDLEDAPALATVAFSGKYNDLTGKIVFADGTNSVIESDTNTASGFHCHAGGQGNSASGVYTFVHGEGNASTGGLNAIFGNGNNDNGKSYCLIAGTYNTPTANYQTIIGKHANPSSDSMLTIGNGAGEGDKSNLFEVRTSGVEFDGTALESTGNKITSVNAQSTDAQYPSAKCVYSLVGDIETLLEELR